MLNWLMGRKDKQQYRVAEGMWVAAIGDIHGQLDALNLLLDQLLKVAEQSRAERKVLVFLGDYVDRGLKSRQVIDRLLLGFDGFETHFLRGNHDETVLQFLNDPNVGDAWRNYGGLETLASYGVPRAAFSDWPQAQAILKQNLPSAHMRFFENLENYFVCGSYLFVHAGIRPGIPIDMQAQHDLMWIRDDFLNSNVDHGYRVVHGHTPKERPDVRPNRIGIDTGAYMTGALTAVVLDGVSVLLLDSRGRVSQAS